MKAIGKFKWGWTNSLELNPLGDFACEYEREASLFWENYTEILKGFRWMIAHGAM